MDELDGDEIPYWQYAEIVFAERWRLPIGSIDSMPICDRQRYLDVLGGLARTQREKIPPPPKD